ncbi:HAD family hydrolase [Paenibacillus sp. NPDC058910]|uniref:HAD family hydrolase n=1 Tax=unclassified Paenibacillus TaxID=185978 RepID=UPI0036B5DE22
MIKAVVFDLDDTLYMEKEYVISGFQEVDLWVRRHFKVQGFFEKAILLFNQGHRGHIFNEALELLNTDIDYGKVQQMIRVYREHLPNIQLYPDARWALQYFFDKAVTGLLTDGFLEAQRQKVKALGIGSCFKSIVYSDEMGREYWKPSPIPYIRISMNMGIDPKQCVYIGDNPQKDFIMAKRLGWTTICVKRADDLYSGVAIGSDYLADYQISTLYELKHINFL